MAVSGLVLGEVTHGYNGHGGLTTRTNEVAGYLTPLRMFIHVPGPLCGAGDQFSRWSPLGGDSQGEGLVWQCGVSTSVTWRGS
jgi:hypothetical protein